MTATRDDATSATDVPPPSLGSVPLVIPVVEPARDGGEPRAGDAVRANPYAAPSPSSQPSPRRAAREPLPPPADRQMFVASSMLSIVAVLMLTFAATLALIGPVRHARDQQTLFADLRYTLANATAPVTQTDGDGQLHPLGTPLAVLDIPQIGVREVVVEGTNSNTLISGPGHRRDTPLPGQAGTSVIMGRQAAFGAPFRDLGALSKGDVFSVTTGQGKHTYRVITVRREGDLLPPALEAGKGRLTLITAAGRAWVPEGLLRVDADLVTPVQPTGARPLTASGLPPAEIALASDFSRLVWVVLLAQVLLLAAIAVTWARYRWGRWQVWLAGGPVVLAVGVALTVQIASLLPNLL